MTAKNYLRKCPFCDCYFFSAKDLQHHVKHSHDREINDVPPYSLEKEASERILAQYIYKYRPAARGKCELCGSAEDVYVVGVEDGSVLRRCRSCLSDMMARMKSVRFIRVEMNESVRGSKRKVGGLDFY